MKKIAQFLIFLSTLYGICQDGQLDSSFSPTINFNNSMRTIVEQTDGKILIGGWFTNNGSYPIYRLNQDGTLDTSFNAPVFNSTIEAIVVQVDNKIIVGGRYPAFLIRLNDDGSVDPTFNAVVDSEGSISTLKILEDNKIMVAGIFDDINGVPIQSIAKLNADGSVDNSFNLNLPPVTFLWDFEVQTDSKVIIAGANDEGTQYLLFRRYNPNGSPDPTFLAEDPSTGDYIYDIELDIQGKILISGPFNKVDNITRYSLARLNNNGTLDTSFNSYNIPHNGTTHTIFGVKALEDGKYFINGSFSMYNGMESNSIAKINNNGTIDTSFTIGTGPNLYVWSSCIQQDGKILIGGDFTEYNGTSINRIARLGNTLSIEENPFATGILVYPNPFKNTINISVVDKYPISVSIYTLTGQLIKTEILSQFKTINTQTLSSGIYLAHISNGKNSITAKLIKE